MGPSATRPRSSRRSNRAGAALRARSWRPGSREPGSTWRGRGPEPPWVGWRVRMRTDPEARAGSLAGLGGQTLKHFLAGEDLQIRAHDLLDPVRICLLQREDSRQDVLDHSLGEPIHVTGGLLDQAQEGMGLNAARRLRILRHALRLPRRQRHLVHAQKGREQHPIGLQLRPASPFGRRTLRLRRLPHFGVREQPHVRPKGGEIVGCARSVTQLQPGDPAPQADWAARSSSSAPSPSLSRASP